jgi:hypothetical protein
MTETLGPNEYHRMNRRQFLSRAGSGFGAVALASMLNDDSLSAATTDATRSTHYTPKAKSVIWLFMNGGPSGIDLFDHKPELDRRDGESFPGKIESLFPFPGPIMRSPYKFRRHGECGAMVSEVLPNLARHVDDMTILKACVSQGQNHVPACYMMNTGATRVGFPCVGSWLTYGLGTENRDLPGFIVMLDHRASPEGGANLWEAGYLPAENQGVPFRPSERPILYLNRPRKISEQSQQAQLKLLRAFNELHLESRPQNGELEARIESFETAARMQLSVPNLVDLSGETEETKRLYGLDVEQCKPFGTQLLMARRLVEKGVRSIQIYHGGYETNWDHHTNLEKGHRNLCFETDQPIAGLISDLKRRGLLESTLIVWGGEFGRLPVSQDRNGRDHNPYGFTMWLAGGGVKSGYSFGQTDEFGYKAVEDPVNVRDLHATILRLAGLDHGRLTYYFNGRDQSLTNGLGRVVHEIIA